MIWAIKKVQAQFRTIRVFWGGAEAEGTTVLVILAGHKAISRLEYLLVMEVTFVS